MSNQTDTRRQEALEAILPYHTERFRRTKEKRAAHGIRHVGLELKFPVVDRYGDAAGAELIDEFWRVCLETGWEPLVDSHTGGVTGVRSGDLANPDLIQTTTGICVLEFSVAHGTDLFELEGRLKQLARPVAEFASRTGSRLLGLGIQPKTPPSADLLAKKGRHLFWDEVLPPCDDTPHGEQGSVELFTVIADNQVHVDVSLDEAAPAVNLLNGLAGPMLALTANSSVWGGKLDPQHVAVRELFWDWWIGDGTRCGMPARPFENFADYVRSTAELRPVVTTRGDRHLSLCHYPTFADFYAADSPYGVTADEESVPLEPCEQDIDLHDRAFWWNARLSRFATLESRVSCQQPPGEMLAPAALVLGLVEAFDVARGMLVGFDWEQLRELRVRAAHDGLNARTEGAAVRHLAEPLLALAEHGLRARGFGEEEFLRPVGERLAWYGEPARGVRDSYSRGGVLELIHDYAWA